MKQGWKKSVGILFCMIVLCSAIPVQAKEQVKISGKEYLLNLTNAGPLFISNDIPVSGEIGSKVFFTYTVAEVTSNKATQNGIIGAKNNEVAYPYTEEYGGIMKYTQLEEGTVLFEEGWTYVFRFERTEAGIDYSCAKLKDDKEIGIEFLSTANGSKDDAFNYYGIYCAGGDGITALLNHVRCYDENGKDLGIHLNASTAVIQSEVNVLIDNHLPIRTSYKFEVENKGTMAISNKYSTDSDVVYMEYEVAEVTEDLTTQHGVIVTQTPQAMYPHTQSNGMMKFVKFTEEENNPDRILLRPGAKYFLCFVKKEEGYDVIIQRTLNGKVESITFPFTTGVYNKDYSYFSIWLGEGDTHGFSAKFKNFKCYDLEGNNLGIQIRHDDIKIKEIGEAGNYETSIGDYYCAEKDAFISLMDDKKATTLVQNKITSLGYEIYEKVLHLNFKDGKEILDYTPMLLTDNDGNEYVRITPSKVRFVVGEETREVKTGISNAYRIEKPEDPTREGNQFKGWCLGNGKEFDFDTVITESITLYAKWENSEGYEYLDGNLKDNLAAFVGDYSKEIIIVISALILLSCVIACVVIGKGGARNGKNKEKTNK